MLAGSWVFFAPFAGEIYRRDAESAEFSQRFNPAYRQAGAKTQGRSKSPLDKGTQ